MSEMQEKWDAIYRQTQQAAQVAEVLAGNPFLLPANGRALDLACGLGGNALFLAEAGLNVDAWDISELALRNLQEQALERRLDIRIRHCSIGPELLAAGSYDVIVISRFLDRTLCNAIMAALKTGGLLFYQTFTREKHDQNGPRNPDYLLARNELLRLFAPLTLIFYQEYAQIGNLQFGDRNEAGFIGQKS